MYNCITQPVKKGVFFWQRIIYFAIRIKMLQTFSVFEQTHTTKPHPKRTYFIPLLNNSNAIMWRNIHKIESFSQKNDNRKSVGTFRKKKWTRIYQSSQVQKRKGTYLSKTRNVTMGHSIMGQILNSNLEKIMEIQTMIKKI